MDREKTLQRPILVGLTVISIVAAFDISTLAHEWTHATVAWLMGYKDNPFHIYYGNWTLLNVNEAIDYRSLFAMGQKTAASAIGISALITNAVLFIASLCWLSRKSVQQRKWLYLFLYWFALMNISELYSYIPLRTFAPSGDIKNFVDGLAISPWTVFLPGSLVIGVGIWYFLREVTPKAYELLELVSGLSRRIFLGATLFIMFIFFGLTPIHYYGPHDANKLWALFSIALGLGLFFLFNPVTTERKKETGGERIG